MNRAELRFSEQARNAFAYLVDELGFRVTRQLDTLVRFESDTVFVQIYHGRISFEVGLEFGLLGEPDTDRYGLGTLIEVQNSEGGQNYRLPAVRESDAVHRALHRTAALFREYGLEAATGDSRLFRRLGELRERRTAARIAEWEAAQARPQAEKAFKGGDYQTVVDAYSSIEKVLSPVERKKLAYARKKTGR